MDAVGKERDGLSIKPMEGSEELRLFACAGMRVAGDLN